MTERVPRLDPQPGDVWGLGLDRVYVLGRPDVGRVRIRVNAGAEDIWGVVQLAYALLQGGWILMEHAEDESR